MPHGVSHYVVWTRLPIVHPDVVPPEVRGKVNVDGLWGFVGSDTTPKYDGPDAPLLKVAGQEMDAFVRNFWPESDWESAWFMNPPVRDNNLTAYAPACLTKSTSSSAFKACQGLPTFTYLLKENLKVTRNRGSLLW